MVQSITEHNIDEVLKNPQNYITEETDLVLSKVYGANSAGPVVLMVGFDPDAGVTGLGGMYYVVEEDDATSTYHYCLAHELEKTYGAILKRLVAEVEGKQKCPVTESSFEDFLVEKNDQISFFAHQLLCAMASCKPIDCDSQSEVLEWDMEHIGSVIMHAEGVLEKMGITPCYPFYEENEGSAEENDRWENGLPCPKGKDCDRTDCVFCRAKENP